jgi:hypothetical protein
MWEGWRTTKGISWKTEQLHERWSADVSTLVIYPSACLWFVTLGLINISKEDREITLWSLCQLYLIAGQNLGPLAVMFPLSALRHSSTELRATCCYVCAMYPVMRALWVVADGTEKSYFLVGVYRRRQIHLKQWWPTTRPCFVAYRNMTV